MADDGATVSWSIAPTDTPTGRLACYVLVGALGGFATLFVALAGIALGAVVLERDAGTLALIALFVLVGGPFSLLYLGPLLVDPDERPGLPRPFDRIDRHALHPVVLAGSVTIGALLLARLFLQRPVYAFVGLGVLLVGAILAVSLTAPEGAVDPTTGTLTVYDRTYDLEALTGVRTYPFGALRLVRPRFASTPGGRDAPAFFTIPRSDYDRAEKAFDRGIDAATTPVVSRSTGERLALATFGITGLALAAAIAFFGTGSTTDGAEILYWVASLPAIVALYVLSLATRRSR